MGALKPASEGAICVPSKSECCAEYSVRCVSVKVRPPSEAATDRRAEAGVSPIPLRVSVGVCM